MKYADLTTQNNNKTPKKSGIATLLIIVMVLAAILATGFIFKNKIKGLFNPISIVSNIASVSDLKETDGRINVLLLGSDKRQLGNVTSILTDTLLVASIGKVDNDVVLISLPRDLWVKWTDTRGQERFSKINAIYNSSDGGTDPLTKTVEDVLGMPIHYYSLVSFDLFKDVINILGGIEVDVETAFTDTLYPIEGMENAPNESDRYEVITFKTGKQTMNGETALKYVRSRHGDNNEGTDFARSKRQQKVISALKTKAMSTKTLLNPIKIKELYEAYSKNVDTNVTFSNVQSFYLLSQQIDFEKIISVVLDDRSEAVDGGLLYAPEDTTLYAGQYVLIPKTGGYSQIHAYVQKYLFGDK